MTPPPPFAGEDRLQAPGGRDEESYLAPLPPPAADPLRPAERSRLLEMLTEAQPAAPPALLPPLHHHSQLLPQLSSRQPSQLPGLTGTQLFSVTHLEFR